MNELTPQEKLFRAVYSIDIQRTWEELPKILSDLTPREQKVLETRFGLNDGITHTLEEVGKEFGVTRERIRQIEEKALEKIKIYYKGNY